MRPQVSTPGLIIYQTFQSRKTITLQVPLYPVPEQTAIDQDPIYGFRVQSDDYDLRLYHLLDLKDARTQCQSFLSEEANSSMFDELKNYADSPLKDRGAAQFEFTHDGEKVVATKFCVIETDHNVWAIEVLIENTLFQKKYKSIIWEMVGSFDYSK